MTTPTTRLARTTAASSALGRLADCAPAGIPVVLAIGTALVLLGPRSFIVAGRSGTFTWLALHPRLSAAVETLGGVHDAGNLALFVPLAVALALVVSPRRLLAAAALLLLAPGVAEWAQQHLPGRVSDPADVLMNTLGAGVAFAAATAARCAAVLAVRAMRPSR